MVVADAMASPEWDYAMMILIAYYSFTSTVESLARAIATDLSSSHEVTLTAIRPKQERGYWNWLARSFLPGSTVAIENPGLRFDDFDRVCLGFPKWTFSCPPLSRYLNLLPVAPGKRFGLFMAFGGFDEDRYLRQIEAKVSRKGGIAAILAVRRRLVSTPECLAAVHSFCQALVEPTAHPFQLKLDVRR